MSPAQSRWYTSPALGAAPFLVAVTVLGRSAQNIGQTTYPLEARQLFGISDGLLGTIVAVAGIAGVVTAATVGARVTVSNSLVMMTAGQSMTLAAFVLLALPQAGVPGLWMGIVLLGTGGGLVFPATMTAVGGGAKGNPARPMAVYALALSVGLVVGPLLESGTLHLLSQSLRETFAALLPIPAAATAIAAAGAFTLGRQRQPLVTMTALELPPTDPALGPPTATVPLVARTTIGAPRGIRGAREARETGRRPPLLRIPAYRLSLATLLTYQAPFAAIVTFGGLLARRVDGASPAGVELGFAAFFTVSFVVRALVVRTSPIHHVRLALISSVVATAGGIALLALGHGFVIFTLAMAVLGAPHGLTFPLAAGKLAEGVSPADLGRANARLMATTNSASVAVPLVFGLLAGIIGYRSTFLLIEVPVALFASALILELARRPAPVELPG